MTPLTGHLLVATPELLAAVFTRSVILMLDHSEGGAVGVILNRPTEATLKAVAGQVFDGAEVDWDKSIGLGGPVPGPLVALHTAADLADDEVLPGLYRTAEAHKLRDLAGRRAEPSAFLANYAGWSPGQLEGEIAEGSWVTLPANPELVFWDGAGDLWDAAMKRYNGRRLTGLLGIDDGPADPTRN